MNKKYNNKIRCQPKGQLQKYQRQVIKANNQIKHSTAKISVQSRERNQQLERKRIRREWEEKFGFLAAVVMNAENEKAKGKNKNTLDWTACVLLPLAAAIFFFFFLYVGIMVLN